MPRRGLPIVSPKRKKRTQRELSRSHSSERQENIYDFLLDPETRQYSISRLRRTQYIYPAKGGKYTHSDAWTPLLKRRKKEHQSKGYGYEENHFTTRSSPARDMRARPPQGKPKKK